MAYVITGKGRRHLAGAWRALLESPPPNDIDATLRIAALALASGAKHGEVATFLRDAAKQRTDSEHGRQAEQVDLTPGSAGGYRWMRSRYSSARLACERDVLLEIAEELGRPTRAGFGR